MHLSLRSAIVSVCLFLSLCHLSAEEDIRVTLETRNQLSSIYLAKLQVQQSALPCSYINTLRGILQFDLAHCGYAKLAQIDEILEKALCHTDPHVAFNPDRWSKAGAAHVISGNVYGHTLNLSAFSVGTSKLKHYDDITLSGDIGTDRRRLHKLSDTLIEALFGKQGVSNSRILFSIQKGVVHGSERQWRAEIWECDWDGENLRQVTHDKSYAITPVLLPTHPIHRTNRFLYVNYKTGQPKIYLSSLGSKEGKPLIPLRGNQLLPAISRQRDKLAFISDAGGRADLFVQSVDQTGQLIGKPVQLFSYPRSTQGSPTFSPDGKKIAFVSDKDGSPRIYLIDAFAKDNKRPKPTLLTKRNRENTCPVWSPDGKKLAYSAKTNGVRQIWIYDFSAEEEEQLTIGSGNKENPCWAPNSLHLVFNSTNPDSSELYLVNLNQPEAVKITSGQGKKHYPTWGNR